MTWGSVEVRRLSTISSVLDPSFALTTKWIWYWDDEYGNWIQYGTSQETHNISSITSEFLEWKYQENSSAIITFTTAEHSYEVNMQDMMQYNKQSNTKMRVRRRPLFLSAVDVQDIITRETESEDHSQNPQALPCDSDKANTSATGFKRVVLNSDTNEYKKIVERFDQTMSEFNVKNIEKVLNADLWEDFQRHVNVMKQKNVGKENEILLFHGTESKQIDVICQQSTDRRICEAHERAFGKGSYFTRDAKSSHRSTDESGTQCMFLCRVFIGEYTNGHPSYIHPPLKDGENDVFYDSCVNDINIPSIFVVFEKNQVYPEYLIQYEKGAGNSPQNVSLNQYSSSSQASFSVPSVSCHLSPQYFSPQFQYTNLTSVRFAAPLMAPNFYFTPVLHSPFFAHSKKKYFQAGAPRFPFPVRNPTRPQKRGGSSHGGFRSMHLPPNFLAHTRTSFSVRKDTAKQLFSNSMRSASESHPMPLHTTLSTITRESKSAKTQDARQQMSRPAGGLSPANFSASVSSDTKTSKSVKAQNARQQGSNSTRSYSGLNPGTTSASTSIHIDASKSVRSEYARAIGDSRLSSRSRTSSDMDSTKAAGKSPKNSASQSTKPAGESSRSSASQSTKPAGERSRSSASQSTKPAGESSRSSASQSTKPAGERSRSSASQSTKPAGESSRSSASQRNKPAGESSRSSASQRTKPASESSRSSASQRTKPASESSRSSASQRNKPAGKSSKSATGRH
ncbi:uncharacterized protein LOC128623421 isoform X2 [Ictalurus furcatus]|nr:uncharacterized protein LOC128623421 isoform X2 [Ictalurus furcatus]